jgi:hypothetical protein
MSDRSKGLDPDLEPIAATPDPVTLRRIIDLERGLRESNEAHARSLAMLFAVNARLSGLEARAGVEPPPAPAAGLVPVKQAAHDSGFSQSYVRKLVRTNKQVRFQWLGKRLFVDPRTLPHGCR